MARKKVLKSSTENMVGTLPDWVIKDYIKKDEKNANNEDVYLLTMRKILTGTIAKSS